MPVNKFVIVQHFNESMIVCRKPVANPESPVASVNQNDVRIGDDNRDFTKHIVKTP